MADLILRTKDGVPYYTGPQLNAFPKVRHAFFTRNGGVSGGMYESLNFRLSSDDATDHVLKNFAIAAGVLGARSEQIARTKQYHTDTIMVVQDAAGPQLSPDAPQVDALITNKPGICLTGFYADCQLVMLYDQKRKAVGIAHSGWRGVANEIVRKTIERMGKEFGTLPGDLSVAVGPSICRRCFETDADVPEILVGVYGDLIQEYIYKEQEKWHVDLKNITYSTLLRYGVHPLNIDISNQCTSCSIEKHFWSHRRVGEDRGVHAGMIMML